MKAIFYKKYGFPNVLRLVETEKLTPRDNEVLVKIFATTVHRTDCATIQGIHFFMIIVTGLLTPKKSTLGTELAGKIYVIGKNNYSFKVGDKVFGFDDAGTAAHVQYTAITENKLMIMPLSITYEEAVASIEGSRYAYNFFNKVDLKKGHKFLVNGATGAIGSTAVHLLNYFGANVTGVCATKNIDLVKSMGANRVIDYTTSNLTSDIYKQHYMFDMAGEILFLNVNHYLLEADGFYISSDLGYLWQNLLLPIITPLLKPFKKNTISNAGR